MGDVYTLIDKSALLSTPQGPVVAGLTPHAVALGYSRVPRFVGQSCDLRVVGQHCCMMARAMQRLGYTPDQRMAALLHDAHEIFIGDIPSPIKPLLRGLKALTEDLDEQIMRCLDVPIRLVEHERDVKIFDLAALHYEAVHYAPGGYWWTKLIGSIEDTVPRSIIDIMHCAAVDLPVSDVYDATLSIYHNLKAEIEHGRFISRDI